MNNRINNKHKKHSTGEYAKHPRRYTKHLGNKRLRKSDNPKSLEMQFNRDPRYYSQNRKNAKRKRSGICPVCLLKLEKNSKGTRYIKVCRSCGAALSEEIKCYSCASYRVWVSKIVAFCKGCGQENQKPQKSSRIKKRSCLFKGH